MRREKVKGRCSHADCNRRAKVKHECITCEKLDKEITTVLGCRDHASWAESAIKRHALVAHPVNLLRAGVAALKGEDIE